MLKRLIQHCKLWNRWRKRSGGSKLYKIMVLINLQKSPSFIYMKINENLAICIKTSLEMVTASINGLCEALGEFNENIIGKDDNMDEMKNNERSKGGEK